MFFSLPANRVNRNRGTRGGQVLPVFLNITAAITAADAHAVGLSGRYSTDSAVSVILPALSRAYRWRARARVFHNATLQNNNRLTAVYALLAVTIFTGASLFVTGTFVADGGAEAYYNTALYSYLEYSLGVFRNIQGMPPC